MLIRVNVDAPDDKITEFGAGAKLYWYRDNTSSTGPFTDATGSVTLVATQSQYEIIDATGALGHWYRTRVGNSGATTFDTYSDPFQAGAKRTYATLDSLREVLFPGQTNIGASRDNFLSDLLVRATDHISARCGRDFFRHPQVTGTETRTFNTEYGSTVLLVPAGIISLTSVGLASYTGASYSTLTGSDWRYWPLTKADDMSYDGIVLSDQGGYRYWYGAYAGATLTGAFGWASIPSMIETATLDLAREWYRQGPGGGGPVGVNQFGTPMFAAGEPKSVRDAIARYGLTALVA